MSIDVSVPRKVLWELVLNVPDSEKYNILESYLRPKMNCDTLSDTVKIKIRTFLSHLKKRWQESSRTREKFLRNFSGWIESNEIFSVSQQELVVPLSLNTGTPAKVGRPQKEFSEAGERTKRRRTAELLADHSCAEITHAAQCSLRMTGNSEAAFLLKQSLETTPTRGAKIKSVWEEKIKTGDVKKYSSDEALGLLVDLRLSKNQYLQLRSSAKGKNADIYPRYSQVLEVKITCYPAENTVKIAETCAEVTLQGLLNITIKRLVDGLLLKGTITLPEITEIADLRLILKYGFDGSSRQAQYKQKFEDGSNASDSHMFLSSLVPLQLICQDRVLWTNDRANSTRYCRPIRFQYLPETPELVKREHENIQEQINTLAHSTFTVAAGNVEAVQLKVSHDLVLSMIDGKVCMYLTETSSAQRCPNCGATPKQMNDIQALVNRTVSKTSLMLGLSPLHAHIRCLEYLLHVAYRLEVQKWAVTGDEDKKRMAQKKTYVQEKFKQEMGLRIDFVSQGSGNSNDGNTARRVFKNPSTAAKILGINDEIIIRFSVILELISSSRKLKTEVFHEYCLKTYELLVETFPWYYVPSSVHRLLMHGSKIIEASPLPVGMLSEEPQEGRNKDYRYFREHHTRKTSRCDTNRDLFNMLIVSSDPLISLMRQDKLLKRKEHELSSEAKQIVFDEPLEEEDTDTDSEDCD